MHYTLPREAQSLLCSYLGPDDCDFDDEAGWCIWNNVNKLWYLLSGKTRSSRTGPERDNGGLPGGKCMNIVYISSCLYTTSPALS